MSSNMTLDYEYYKLAQRAVNEEINEAIPKTKKQVWVDMGKYLEKTGYQKNQISKHIQDTIEELLYSKTGKKIKINTSHYYTVMAENKWQDESFARNKKVDTETVSKNGSTEIKKTKMQFVKDEPDGLEWEIFDDMLQICRTQVIMLEKIKQKVTINKGAILNMKDKVDTEKQEILVKSSKLAMERRGIMSEQLIKHFKSLKVARELIASNLANLNWAKQHLDDRVTVSNWEKIMAMILIDIGYDKNEIARFLKVNSKHIKLNVNSDDARHGLLSLLDIAKRCPNPKCGIYLSEYFETMIKDHKNNQSFEYDIEPLLTTGYQQQVVKLKREIKRLVEKCGDEQ